MSLQPAKRLFTRLVQKFGVLMDLSAGKGSEPAVILRPSPRLLTMSPPMNPTVFVIRYPGRYGVLTTIISSGIDVTSVPVDWLLFKGFLIERKKKREKWI